MSRETTVAAVAVRSGAARASGRSGRSAWQLQPSEVWLPQRLPQDEEFAGPDECLGY